MSEHRHDIEGGYIVHEDHDLGEGAKSLDPIPFEGHQHLMALIARNYVNEISGPAYRIEVSDGGSET
jgi:hypothetical protein